MKQTKIMLTFFSENKEIIFNIYSETELHEVEIYQQIETMFPSFVKLEYDTEEFFGIKPVFLNNLQSIAIAIF